MLIRRIRNDDDICNVRRPRMSTSRVASSVQSSVCFAVSVILVLIQCAVVSAAAFAAAEDSQVISSSSSRTGDTHFLIYETNTFNSNDEISSSPASILLQQIKSLRNVNGMIFGQGNEFEGFGSKFAAVLPILRTIPSDDLVVISDSRDVIINNRFGDETYAQIAIDEFRAAYEKLANDTSSSSIIVSAEAQCCVSALTHVLPGEYFNADGSRNKRACLSGMDGCLWKGDDSAIPWENFMQDMSSEKCSTARGQDLPHSMYDDIYLNAGLITGTAGNLLAIIQDASINIDEDDQAVLTDYMYRNPDKILLDYGQTLFGTNRGGLIGYMNKESCVFDYNADAKRLVHTKTQSVPLFIHSPGGFYECHDTLSAQLGIVSSPSSSVTSNTATTSRLRHLTWNMNVTVNSTTYYNSTNITISSQYGKSVTNSTSEGLLALLAKARQKKLSLFDRINGVGV